MVIGFVVYLGISLKLLNPFFELLFSGVKMIVKLFAWLVAMCFVSPIIWFAIADMFSCIVVNKRYIVPLSIGIAFCFLIWLLLVSMVLFIF